jgi:hypothetical protein
LQHRQRFAMVRPHGYIDFPPPYTLMPPPPYRP